MEKKSINSLKQWISRIKRYEIKLPNLYEKLEYLKVKSLGYNSPSFSHRISSNGSYTYLGIDYWLELIDDCEREINKIKNEVNTFKKNMSKLNDIELIVLTNYLIEGKTVVSICDEYKITRSVFYGIVKHINKKMIYNVSKY